MDEEGQGEGGRGCTLFVHSRSRMTIDPRIPTMPGRSTSGFHQLGRHCLHQAQSGRGGVKPIFHASHDSLRDAVKTKIV